MKTRFLLFAVFLLVCSTAFSQEADNAKYIEVTGASEITLVPDEIHYLIEIKEYWEEEFDDFSQIDEILKVIDTKGISYMRIGELKNKDMQVYRQQGKIEALKAAQKKAGYLVEALGKRLGDVIRIVEPQESAGYPRYFAAQSNVSSSQSEAYDAFRTIKLKYSMLVRFEIK